MLRNDGTQGIQTTEEISLKSQKVQLVFNGTADSTFKRCPHGDKIFRLSVYILDNDRIYEVPPGGGTS